MIRAGSRPSPRLLPLTLALALGLAAAGAPSALAGTFDLNAKGRTDSDKDRDSYNKPAELFAFFAAAAASPWIWLGIAFEIAYSLLWLAVLSWSEISWAVPMNALEYVLAAAAAYALLGEPVGPLRLAGIAMICGGVAMLSGSWIQAGTVTDESLTHRI